ncbi:MAG: TIGR02253 family HAD-type hydrolase [Planctomycetes bacterium]|nr:TIGR02253 family HAD-type hydrolase [Planctomycetota bacterium]
MSRKPLRAIFFDVDDTVYSTTEFAQNARRNAVKAMIDAGLEYDEEECLAELCEVISEFGSNYEHHFDKLLQRMPSKAYANSSRIIIVAAGMVAYHQTKFRNFGPYEDALDVLRRLRDTGVPMGIITAGLGVKQAEKIVRLGLHHIVDGKYIYITDTIGISKHNPKIYVRACQEIGAPPEECVYIGDNPTVDVDVPNSIGMMTILSRRSGKYSKVEGATQPDHLVHNFWDVLEVIENNYDIIPR